MPKAIHTEDSVRDPAGYFFEITPTDYNGYPNTLFRETRGLHVNVGGIIAVYPAGNIHAGEVESITVVVNSGCTYPWKLVGVADTGTDSGVDLVGLY